jgi:SAM-dependent methyltransferase
VEPAQTGRLYDAIATWWDEQQATSTSGLVYLRRAAQLSANRRRALDVGCGSGRLTATLTGAGYQVVGVDVSPGMLALARGRSPGSHFIQADICTWAPPEQYDLVVAWDSIFHVPHAEQREVLGKLCNALAPGGAVLFTAGGIDGEVTGPMRGQTFYYSSLDVEEYLQVLKARGCRCVLLEMDQYPEEHVVLIGVRA